MAVDVRDRTYVTEVAEVGQRTRSQRSRRFWLWALAGVAAAAVMATWAAGVVTSETGVGTVGPANPVLVNPGGNLPSRYDAALDEHDALSIGFSGAWGSIPSNVGMFDLDLTDPKFAGGTYYMTIAVLNNVQGWEWLQLQFHALNGACEGNTTWATPRSSAILYVETDDSRVVLNELAAGAEYCVGVRAAPKASDPATTYIRRPNSGVIPTMPVFAATVGQSS